MTPTTELPRADEAVKEPGKAWKNRWLAVSVTDDSCFHCGKVTRREAGAEYLNCCKTYATADDARAVGDLLSGQTFNRYLGPIEVTP